MSKLWKSAMMLVSTILCLTILLVSAVNDLYDDLPTGKLPNFVFVMTDDIGWNDVGWNNRNMHTPHMDKLAKEGVILDQFYVHPLCSPSRAALLSGLYAQQLGLQREVIYPQEASGVALKYKLLPEVLKKRGYKTHAVGKWHLGFCDWRYTPTYRGFDTFLGFYNGYEENYQHCVNPSSVYDPMTNCTQFDFRFNEKVAKEYNGVYSSYVQNDRTVEIIKQHKHSESPLFMYVALSSMHFPVQGDKYTKQCTNDNKSRREFCGAMIGVDEVVHNITEALKENGLYDNTVIMFATDNGGDAYFGGNNYPLRGNKGTLWEGGTRVPGFVHSPLLEKTGYTYKGLFHVVDWYTTILHLAGIKPSDEYELSGVNQWESLSKGKSNPRNDFPYLMDKISGTIIGAVRVGDYKLIVGPGGNADGWYTESDTTDRSYDSAFLNTFLKGIKNLYNLTDTSLKLYNLARDPYEENNLANNESEKLADVRKVFDKYFSMVKPALDKATHIEAHPDNFGGTYSPGWCTANYEVPNERK